MDLEKTRFAELAKLQVSITRKGDWDFWDTLSASEFDAVNPHIKEIERPLRILDLGCGLGRVTACFSQLYPAPPAKYYLADSTGNKATWGWDAPEGYYNDLALTEEFVKTRGKVEDLELIDLQTDALDSLKDIDVVLSFLSVGFHYPLKGYLKRLLKITTPDCVMAFGVRRGIYKEKSFAKVFSFCEIVEGTAISVGNARTKEDILILKGKLSEA